MDNKYRVEKQPKALVNSETIPVVQEELVVGKKEVSTGKIKVKKNVEEDHYLVSVPVNNEEYEVQRIPINRYIENAPAGIYHEGDTTVIPVVREEVVVEKRLVLVEEIRITKRETSGNVEKEVTLRKEEVVVEHVSKDKPVVNNPRATDDREDLLWENQK